MHLTLYIAGEPVKQWPLQMSAINWEQPIAPQRDLQDAYIKGIMVIARAETDHLIQYEQFEFVLEAKSKFPKPLQLTPTYIWLSEENDYIHLPLRNPLIELNAQQGGG